MLLNLLPHQLSWPISKDQGLKQWKLLCTVFVSFQAYSREWNIADDARPLSITRYSWTTVSIVGSITQLDGKDPFLLLGAHFAVHNSSLTFNCISGWNKTLLPRKLPPPPPQCSSEKKKFRRTACAVVHLYGLVHKHKPDMKSCSVFNVDLNSVVQTTIKWMKFMLLFGGMECRTVMFYKITFMSVIPS